MQLTESAFGSMALSFVSPSSTASSPVAICKAPASPACTRSAARRCAGFVGCAATDRRDGSGLGRTNLGTPTWRILWGQREGTAQLVVAIPARAPS